jgi:hypothetical protein
MGVIGRGASIDGSIPPGADWDYARLRFRADDGSDAENFVFAGSSEQIKNIFASQRYP